VHVTRRRRTGGRCGALVHVHTAALDPLEIVMIEGLPAGLPPPVLQWEVHAAATGAFVGRVDMGWPGHRTVGEFDGLVKYGRTLRPGQDIAEVLVEEKLREDALRDEDLGVVRWIWKDLANFGPTAERLRSRFRSL
jgi:hypothetical protein